MFEFMSTWFVILITVSGSDPGHNRSVISWIETDSSDSDRGDELLSCCILWGVGQLNKQE